MKRTILRRIIQILAFYPLVLILIPRVFGYYLYGPLNSTSSILISWVILFVLVTFGGQKWPKKEVSWYYGVALIVGLVYFILSSFGQIYGAMKQITPSDQLEKWTNMEKEFNLEQEDFDCTATFYSSKAKGGGLFSFGSFGGGTFVDSIIPGYKRNPNEEEMSEIQDCSTTRVITPREE